MAGAPQAASDLRALLDKFDTGRITASDKVTGSPRPTSRSNSINSSGVWTPKGMQHSSGDLIVAVESGTFETPKSSVTAKPQPETDVEATPDKTGFTAVSGSGAPTPQTLDLERRAVETPQIVEVDEVVPVVHEPGAEVPPWQTVGFAVPRRERQEWKGMLKTTISSKAKERDPHITSEILQGNFSRSVREHIQAKIQLRCIRTLLNATSTDTEVERELLLSDVVPFLQEYAMKNKLELSLFDLDYGSTSEIVTKADQDLKRELLQKCVAQSKGFALCHLATQKYGPRPLPSRIPRAVLEAWLEALGDEDGEKVIAEHYKPDLNDVSPERWDDSFAEFVLTSDLSPLDESIDVQAKYDALLSALKSAAERCTSLEGEGFDASTREVFKTVCGHVEEQVIRACASVDEDTAKSKIMVISRTITDLDDVSASDPLKDAYVDIADGSTDEEAQQLLSKLERKLPSTSTRVQCEPLQWGPGVDPSISAHAEYLRKLADSVCGEFCSSIEQAYTAAAYKADAVATEALLHLTLACGRSEQFCETEIASNALKAVGRYLHSGAQGDAMVVHGRCGSGKTMLLARCVAERAAEEQKAAVVVRFLGQSRQSRSVQALLESVVRQLARVYGQSCGELDNWKMLRPMFTTAVTEWPSADKPLMLFLDALDQLDDYQGGRRLEWLPVKQLPPHVRLVVTTRPDNDLEVPVASSPGAGAAPEGLGAGGSVGIGAGFWCLSLLQRKINAAAMTCLDGDVDHAEIVPLLLWQKGRRVTAEQMAACSRAVEWRSGLETTGDSMLWLSLVSDIMAKWHSDDADKQEPGCSVKEVVEGLLNAVADRRGGGVARGIAACLAYSKAGVTQSELMHLLSLDDDALADAYRRCSQVPAIRVIPARSAISALADLTPLLSRRVDGSGCELVIWKHSSIRIFATQWLEAREGIVGRRRRHEQLADFFCGCWADKAKRYTPALAEVVQEQYPAQWEGTRMVPRQPLVLQGSLLQRGANLTLNLRRLEELVHHQILAGREEAAVQELCSIEYMTAKQTSGMGVDLVSELSHAMQVFSGSGERLHQAMSFLRRNEKMLRNEKMGEAPFQLAMQEPVNSPVKKNFVPDSPAVQDRIGGKCRLIEWLNKREEAFPCLMSLSEHDGQVNAVACSPDGTRAASGSSDNLIKICRLATGELETTLQGHTHWVTSIAFSADGEVLVSGSVDTSVRIWDLKRGEQKFALAGHGGPVNCVCISPDGSIVASAGTDKMIRVWDLRPLVLESSDEAGNKGEIAPSRRKTTEGVQGGCCPCFFSRPKPDLPTETGPGKMLPTDGMAPPPPASSSPVLRGVLKGHTSWVNTVSFHPDGLAMISGSNDEVKLWHIGTMSERSTMVGHDGPVNAVALGGDGTIALSGGSDGVVKVWDISDVVKPSTGGRRVRREEGTSTEGETGAGRGRPCELGRFAGHLQSVTSLAVSQDGDFVVSGSSDKQVKLWQLSTMQEAGVLDGHTRGVKAVAFSPDGKVILSGGSDGLVKVWERTNNSGGRRVKAHSHTVSAVAISHDGLRAGSASFDGSLRIWDAETGEEMSSSLKGHTDRVTCMAISPCGTTIVSGSNDYTVRLWDAIEGRERKCMTGHTHRVTHVVFSTDGKTVASSSIDKTVRLWDVDSGTRIGQPLDGHFEGVSTVAMSPDCNLVASGSYDNDVRLYMLPLTADANQGDRLRGHNNWLKALRFSPDSRTLASAGDDATIRLWDTETRAPKSVLVGHTSWVTWLSFSHDGATLVSGSQGDVRLWDIESGQSKGQPLIGTCCTLHSKTNAHVPATPGTPATPTTGPAAVWYVVTADTYMIRVYQVTPRKKKADEVKLAACFFAPSPVKNVSACGTAICAGCDTGDVLLLKAAFMR